MSLPQDYKQIEYIEATGKQYVNTGYIANANTRILMDVKITNVLPETALFGISISGALTGDVSNALIIEGAETIRSDYYGDTKSASVNLSGRLKIDRNKNVTKIGSATITNAAKKNSGDPVLGLLATNTGGFISEKFEKMAHARLYSFKIYNGKKLVRDFVPALNPAGAAGLYDLTGNKFYASASGTPFIYSDAISPPENLHILSRTPDSVSVAWEAVQGASGYKVQLDGETVAETTGTEFSVKLKPFSVSAVGVRSFNADSVSVAAVLIVPYTIPANILDFLITDRTNADVAAKNEKGTYNAADLNRVSCAHEYIRSLMDLYGYHVPGKIPADWKVNDIVFLSDMQKHINAVNGIDRIKYSENPVDVPKTMERMTEADANKIELFLKNLGKAVEKIPDSWYYCNEIFAREV